jgi:hypothetical protein
VQISNVSLRFTKRWIQNIRTVTSAVVDDPMDVTVCENESRARVICEVARLFEENYVSFKMLLVEGILRSFDGDDGHA